MVKGLRTKKLQISKVLLLFTGLSLIGYGCDEPSNFKASPSVTPEPAEVSKSSNGASGSAKEIYIMGGNDEDLSDIKLNMDTPISLKIDTQPVMRFERNEKQLQPLDLYFVVDVTASMSNEIAQVKNGLKQITEKMRLKGIDLWAGFIGFVDTKDQVTAGIDFKLSKDIDALVNFLGSVSVIGNVDEPEGSLMATQLAISRFVLGEGRPDAFKSILLISDVVGHNGTGVDYQRDCTIAKTAEFINRFSSSLFSPSRFKFFYNVADAATLPDGADKNMANYTCSLPSGSTPASFNAKTQMAALMDAILPSVKKELRGGELVTSTGKASWPLENNVLVESLSSMIEKSVPTKMDFACKAKNVKAFFKGEVFSEWSLTNPGNAVMDSNHLVIPNFIAKRAEAGERNLGFQIERCCQIQSVVSQVEKSSEECKTTLSQKVKVKIISTDNETKVP